MNCVPNLSLQANWKFDKSQQTVRRRRFDRCHREGLAQPRREGRFPICNSSAVDRPLSPMATTDAAIIIGTE